ncbi:hypothetical protein HQQ81_05725 [Microbacteriaceae bacterium VKM Ac-2854]|nr:hypothetical protein [Microbacteriaceae bacterium VKM Ac-2854]
MSQTPRDSARNGASGVRSRTVRPPLDFFERLRRQSALLAVADEFAVAEPTELNRTIEAAFRGFTLASDRAIDVTASEDGSTLGWLRPIGSLALLVTQDCPPPLVVEHLAAALAAMNAVSIAIEPRQREVLAPLLHELTHFLPDAFAELEVGPHAEYPADATVVALLPGLLVFSAAPPIAWETAADTPAERVALLERYSRFRQLEVPPRR